MPSKPKPAPPGPTRPVELSRLSDLVRFGVKTSQIYRDAMTAGHVQMHVHQIVGPAVAAALWQLGTRHTLVWINAARDGVSVFDQFADALDAYTHTVAGLTKSYLAKATTNPKGKKK